ncbi:hypothetical protein P3S67_030350 [Capsicum chacoense]
MKMIQSSYDPLEDYLKPCLLYMGLFPKGYEIPVSDLLKWWIAEEFVPNIGTLEQEETSMSFLSDLVSRNLVVVSKKRANGEMKCCIILDQDNISPAIWKLEKLRHVDINEFPIRWEDGERVKFEESNDIVLHNLKTLGTCSMSVADMTPKFWNKFPNLEQLRLHIDEFGDVPYYSDSRLITLEMEKHWDLSDKTFERLKFLKLHRVFMTQWICSEESFPSLEYLVIKSCSKLEEIPLSFADQVILRLIKVIDCSNSVGYSALLIEEELEQYGYELLQVHILKND